MDNVSEKGRRTRPAVPAPLLLTIVLVVVVLYLARDVLIPIALATLLTFVLAPIVNALRRRGLGRTSSVLITVLLTFGLIAAIGMIIGVEFRALANELPGYRQNIRDKIADVRFASKGGAIEKIQDTINEVMSEFNKGDQAKPKAPGAVPVVITGKEEAAQPAVPLFNRLLGPLATAALVIVLAIFMLLRREDLRDRIMRLVGYSRLAATTKTIDEAARQVSRYLLRQSLLNMSYGACLGVGLFFIGLPYAALWAFLGGVARYIPYVGAWIGALAPLITGLAVFDTWSAPLLIVGLVIMLELVWNMVLEPLLYGQSMGASEVALLIMIAFWTWLWGPIGLVLAGPLTICVMVIAKAVPGMEFIGLLLSREPALEPHHVLYQRLVAKDGDEAEEIVQSYLKQHPRADFFEHLVLPTLIQCRRDYDRDRLTDQDCEFVLQAVAQLLEEIPTETQNQAVGEFGPEPPPLPLSRLVILGFPVYDQIDSLAVQVFAKFIAEDGGEVVVTSRNKLSDVRLEELPKGNRVVICVACLPGGALFPLRQFCQRLRSRFPSLPVVVGAWGAKDREKAQQQLSGLVGAVAVTFAETRDFLMKLHGPAPGKTLREESTERAAEPKSAETLLGSEHQLT